MKRKQYRITSTVGHDVIKSAWNSSNRAIEEMARELARSTGVMFILTDSKSIKEGFDFVSGMREWMNQLNGGKVVFTITKLAEATA